MTAHSIDFSEYHRSIVTSKTEGIAKGHIDFSFLRLIESKVQPGVKSVIIRKVVDGRGHNLMLQGLDRSNGFNGTGSTQ